MTRSLGARGTSGPSYGSTMAVSLFAIDRSET